MFLILIPLAVGSLNYAFWGEREKLAQSYMQKYPHWVLKRFPDEMIESMYNIPPSYGKCQPVGIAISIGISNFLDSLISNTPAGTMHNAFRHFQVTQKTVSFATKEDNDEILKALEDVKVADRHYSESVSSWFAPIPESQRSALLYPKGCSHNDEIRGPKEIEKIIEPYLKVRDMFVKLAEGQHLSNDYLWLIITSGVVIGVLVVVLLFLMFRRRGERNYETAGVVNPGIYQAVTVDTADYSNLRPL